MKEYYFCHTKWGCKYHLVFVPKRWKQMIFGVIRKHLGEVMRELAWQKECRVEGRLKQIMVHLCISIPPKHAVPYILGT